MANMEYCRFRNTLEDLKDCLSVLETREKICITEEKTAARHLLEEFLGFARREGLLNDYDKNLINTIIEECFCLDPESEE